MHVRFCGRTSSDSALQQAIFPKKRPQQNIKMHVNAFHTGKSVSPPGYRPTTGSGHAEERDRLIFARVFMSEPLPYVTGALGYL